MNVIAFFHAYKFTHFASTGSKTQAPGKLATTGKIKALVFGISNPRPENNPKPQEAYRTIVLESNKKIECWYKSSQVNPAKGTVILFHGYGGEKSSMIDKAGIFDSLGYHTLLVDFMGSGGSEGNTTTIGYKEAAQVKTAYEYIRGKGEKNVYLFGTSMGSAAIMKAIHDDQLKVKGIIVECPFGSLYTTVCARFHNIHAPAFPMAALLVFWGGVQNGYWAFGHNPATYAKAISCPTLLLYGEQDQNVSKAETDEIYANLQGEKRLCTYPLAGHENYLKKYRQAWTNDVTLFLQPLNRQTFEQED
ncbi:alpha/beta fold hydrolase [Filimonas effusa]|uniref:Alpha/beta fold hydrolase n=2 Tax=Filimonas effusa TaxID=2508721 RepID=A0A4Q1D658_9BACT|nr:alpha/beta fold hydrolase [Filimonas effusa]